MQSIVKSMSLTTSPTFCKYLAGKPQSGGASPMEQPPGLGQSVVPGLAEGLLDIGVVKVC